ncbi:GntR family transcriptional regulator [Caulobacter sp. KR2-114]|uniref:GntR family transcriptional regulator n=1 Tax=Caulobacter sp. KR2-114 TaxID=3400912 RepID=UPI003C12B3EE
MRLMSRDEAPPVVPGWAPELQKAKVYEQILLDVILGELPPGSRLDEQDLVRRYGAGLAGVRDALGRLALEGLVVRKPRAGTTVAPLDLVEVRQAFEARRLIEPHCAALAATHATPDDIAALRSAFEGGQAAARARDSRALIGMDQQFHAAIARASRNPTLAQIVIPLQHKAARFWVYSMVEDTEDERLAEIERHQEVVDCITRHDAEAAHAAMLNILGVFSENVKRSVTGGSASDAPASKRYRG